VQGFADNTTKYKQNKPKEMKNLIKLNTQYNSNNTTYPQHTTINTLKSTCTTN
jgi:hypothetical protein